MTQHIGDAMSSTPHTPQRRTSAARARLGAAVATLTPTAALLEEAVSRACRPDGRLADFLPDACFLTDAAGVLLQTNTAASSLLGYARKYCLGKPLASIVLPEDVATFRQKLAQVAALPEGKVLEWTAHLRPPRRERELIVLLRVGTVRHSDGTLLGLRWLVRDVTEEAATVERLRMLEAAHAAELRTRTMALEAVAQMQAAQLVELERTQAELARVTAEARRALQHGAEPRALLAHILDALARAGGEPAA